MEGLLATPLIPGRAVDAETGLLAADDACWTNWEPVELDAGSVIEPLEGFEFRAACYEDGFDDSLARTYTYDPESNWTRLRCMTPLEGWICDPWTLPERSYVRFMVRREDSRPADGLFALGQMLRIDACIPDETPQPACFADEVARVAAAVEAVREPGDAVFIALSDVHYSTGCFWPQTARNVRELSTCVSPQAIIQLGDVTDGIAPLAVTRSFVGRVLDDLRSCGVPVLSCVGNHDANYFKGNAQRLSAEDCARLYIGRKLPYYFEDFPEQRLRCIFLHSFEPEREDRYGYDDRQIRWLRRALRRTPHDFKVVVFSHVTPLPEIHHWSDAILNGPKLLELLERFSAKRGGAVLAFVHGHNHADQVYCKQSFPVVGIGCAKFEDFEECKPPGSITYKRRQGDATQELFDVIVVKPADKRVEFIRFGAGEDRSVRLS